MEVESYSFGPTMRFLCVRSWQEWSLAHKIFGTKGYSRIVSKVRAMR